MSFDPLYIYTSFKVSSQTFTWQNYFSSIANLVRMTYLKIFWDSFHAR
jgi:hypothetical protein